MKNIFFDLDGTIWDASESTAAAWTKVFERWGVGRNISLQDIQSVAGRPYMECLRILVPDVIANKNIENILLDLSSEERKSMSVLGGKFYGGALSLITKLAKKNKLFLVSNCNDWYLNSFLSLSRLENVFVESVCFNTFEKNKAYNLKYLIDKYSLSNGFYIGDTQGDMQAAQMNGLCYIHMAHGFDKTLKTDLVFQDFLELDVFFNSVAQ
jgi:phosphoglycolate phosphatase